MRNKMMLERTVEMKTTVALMEDIIEEFEAVSQPIAFPICSTPHVLLSPYLILSLRHLILNVGGATRGENAFALDVRDSFGSFIAAPTCLAKGFKVYEVEQKALVLAFDIAKGK